MKSKRRRRAALILSGCGVHDGSDVHESVFAWWSLERAGFEVVCSAPDVRVAGVVDHASGQTITEARSVLSESARISRGRIRSLASLRANEVDAAVFPGGSGVTRTWSDRASRGREFTVDPTVAAWIREMHATRKPQAFLCIAPMVAARVLGSSGIEVTVGSDQGLATDIESYGARHRATDAYGIVVDHANRIVSAPAYMLAQNVVELADGIDRAIRALAELTG